MNDNIRHWWIQKRVDNNIPSHAIFEEFKPTVKLNGHEWIKVISLADFHKEVGINITKYISLQRKLTQARESKAAWDNSVKKHKPVIEKLQKEIDLLKTNLSTLAKAYKEQSEILHNFTPENKWEECRSDGNIFDTVDGDPIWVFNEDDCGGYARQYVNSTTHQEALEIIKELEK